MPDALLLIALVFIFLSVPLLIFVIGATTFFAVFFLIQYLQTGNLENLLYADVLMLIFLLAYFTLRKVNNWIKH